MSEVAANLQGQPGVLTMTIEIKRAATGLTETYQLVGTPIPLPEPETTQEAKETPPCL